ncbi:MAG TPA: 3-deoxy-D-manno-octulosonic acid transferase [Patescibacteria group bacterium]|nr:3-deoxy-D-manno-octulosonic acid transferase [Patescibacteria group bacterium]
MSIFYDLIFLIVALAYLPAYLCRRKFHGGFKERLGIFPRMPPLQRPIWIHAVSVGEVMAVRGLLEKLKASYPQKRFVISTVTPTGNKVARSLAKSADVVTYLPLDFSFIVRRVIRKIDPCLFIIAETEIWPNLIRHLRAQGIPIVSVNTRISDRSFRGYRRARWFLKPVLAKINLFCVQTDRDAERLMQLGVGKDAIRLGGNMKFDMTFQAAKTEGQVRAELGLAEGEKLLVAGSTHPGEEAVILEIYKKLLSDFASLRLLIAPRHPERSVEVSGLIRRSGFQPLRISQLGQGPAAGGRQVFLLDTVGQLLLFYAAADIVFVAGSLVKKGGHNILEPASLAKPVLFGPFMSNFRDVADLFLEHHAAVMARNGHELEQHIRALLTDPSAARALGLEARNLILKNQGATARHLEHIRFFKV